MFHRKISVYTIGLKDLSFIDALSWAKNNRIDSLQIRGGQRGYNLLSIEDKERDYLISKSRCDGVCIDSIALDVELLDIDTSFNKFTFLKVRTWLKEFKCNVVRLVIKKWKKRASLKKIIKFFREIDVEILIEFHCKECFCKSEFKRVVRSLYNIKHVMFLLDIEQFLIHNVDYRSIGDVFYQKVKMIHVDVEKNHEQDYYDFFLFLKQREEEFVLCLENWREPQSSVTLAKYLSLKNEFVSYRDS